RPGRSGHAAGFSAASANAAGVQKGLSRCPTAAGARSAAIAETGPAAAAGPWHAEAGGTWPRSTIEEGSAALETWNSPVGNRAASNGKTWYGYSRCTSSPSQKKKPPTATSGPDGLTTKKT